MLAEQHYAFLMQLDDICCILDFFLRQNIKQIRPFLLSRKLFILKMSLLQKSGTRARSTYLFFTSVDQLLPFASVSFSSPSPQTSWKSAADMCYP